MDRPVAAIVHLADIPADALVRRRRGRPPKVRTAPTVSEESYRQEIAHQRASHVAADPLLQHQGDALTSIDLVIQGIAQEVASIRFENQRVAVESRDAGRNSGRIIDGLVKLAGLVLLRRGLRADSDFIEPMLLERLKAMFVETIRETAEVTLGEGGARFVAAVEEKIMGSTSGAPTSG